MKQPTIFKLASVPESTFSAIELLVVPLERNGLKIFISKANVLSLLTCWDGHMFLLGRVGFLESNGKNKTIKN